MIAKCPLCSTPMRGKTKALPDGRRGHTACVNEATAPVPAWRRFDR